jgi:hypothetical protein
MYNSPVKFSPVARIAPPARVSIAIIPAPELPSRVTATARFYATFAR